MRNSLPPLTEKLLIWRHALDAAYFSRSISKKSAYDIFETSSMRPKQLLILMPASQEPRPTQPIDIPGANVTLEPSFTACASTQ